MPIFVRRCADEKERMREFYSSRETRLGLCVRCGPKFPLRSTRRKAPLFCNFKRISKLFVKRAGVISLLVGTVRSKAYNVKVI